MKIILLALALAISTLAQAGGFTAYPNDARPKLFWETLRGYRLFFHPDDSQDLRRSITLALPGVQEVRAAWILIRPWQRSGRAMAWLRVEGRRQWDQIVFDWDGTYRNREFGDNLYEVDVHLRFDDAPEQSGRVPILKSTLHPRILKVGSAEVKDHLVNFAAGQYLPAKADLEISKSAGSLDVLSEVYLPDLGPDYAITGVLLEARPVATTNFFTTFTGPPAWECACLQALPANSPARRGPRKVKCAWDPAGLKPGLYDLRVGLYHQFERLPSKDGGSYPLLDFDTVRVRVKP